MSSRRLIGLAEAKRLGCCFVVESAHVGRGFHRGDGLSEQGIQQPVVVHEPDVASGVADECLKAGPL